MSVRSFPSYEHSQCSGHDGNSTIFQFPVEEPNHRLIEIVVEGRSIETRCIMTDIWDRRSKRLAARRKEDKMIHSRHDVLLWMIRKLLADESTVPLIGSIRVILRPPELNRNADLSQIPRPKEKTYRRCCYDCGFNPRIMNPNGFWSGWALTGLRGSS